MPVAARYSSADQLVCELPAWPYAETVTSVSILNLDTGSVLPPHPADETFFLNFRGAFREAPVHACLHPLRVSVPAKVGGVLRMQRDANVHPPPRPCTVEPRGRSESFLAFSDAWGRSRGILDHGGGRRVFLQPL